MSEWYRSQSAKLWYVGSNPTSTSMEKSKKELIKEFQETVCPNCKSYFFCGGECVCIPFEKFIKERATCKE